MISLQYELITDLCHNTDWWVKIEVETLLPSISKRGQIENIKPYHLAFGGRLVPVFAIGNWDAFYKWYLDYPEVHPILLILYQALTNIGDKHGKLKPIIGALKAIDNYESNPDRQNKSRSA